MYFFSRKGLSLSLAGNLNIDFIFYSHLQAYSSSRSVSKLSMKLLLVNMFTVWAKRSFRMIEEETVVVAEH